AASSSSCTMSVSPFGRTKRSNGIATGASAIGGASPVAEQACAAARVATSVASRSMRIGSPPSKVVGGAPGTGPGGGLAAGGQRRSARRLGLEAQDDALVRERVGRHADDER